MALAEGQGYDASAVGLMGLSLGTGAVSLAMAEKPRWRQPPRQPVGGHVIKAAFLANKKAPGLAVITPSMLAMGRLVGDGFGLQPAQLRESLDGRPIAIVPVGRLDSTIPVEQGEPLAAAAREARARSTSGCCRRSSTSGGVRRRRRPGAGWSTSSPQLAAA